jgi:hypothetical protein
MLQITNINKCIGLYNFEGFSAAMLVAQIFETRLINKPRNETEDSELCRYHTNWKQLYKIQ